MYTAFTVKKLKLLLNAFMQENGQGFASVFYYADSKSLNWNRETPPGKILSIITLPEALALDEDKAEFDKEMLREILASFILQFSENATYHQNLEVLFK